MNLKLACNRIDIYIYKFYYLKLLLKQSKKQVNELRIIYSNKWIIQNEKMCIIYLYVFSILKNELFKVQLIFKQRALRYDPVDNRLSL